MKCPAWEDWCEADGCDGEKITYIEHRKENKCYEMIRSSSEEERLAWLEYVWETDS